jgi:hypothetical protein
LPAAVIAATPDTQTADADSLWRNLAPKLYIQDETWADLDYIKSEITFVNYVRDRTEADIQLIITCQTTGDGGKEYCLTFQGLGSYHDIGLVLKHTTAPDATDDEVRKALVDTIKRGLVPYVSCTKLRDWLSVEFTPPSEPTAVSDPWRNWVFSVSLYGYANGVKSYSYLYYDLCPDIRRVTENQKIEFGGDLTANERRYVLDSSVVVARSRGYNVYAIYAQKLTNHFAAGTWGEYLTNDYSNVRLGFAAAPRFEYNLVPYSEYVRHKIFIRFVPSVVYRCYFDTTLYDRMGETRFSNELTLGVNMTRPWGTIELSVTGSHYLHDFSKNHLSRFVCQYIIPGRGGTLGGGFGWL